MIKTKNLLLLAMVYSILISCSKSKDSTISPNSPKSKISPSSNADAKSSYSNSKTNIRIDYYSIPFSGNSGSLRDAIAYIDANGDGITDVFMATGDYLLQGEVKSILAINNGSQKFNSSTTEFNNNLPPATHARKSIVSDFNNDNLKDIFVFDHGYDANPFPGSQCKLVIQNSKGAFSWSKLPEVGFFHGGAAADIDNDGDIDIFVGGFEPFFYINDGTGNFQATRDRLDSNITGIAKVFTAELIDVDKDGYLDLLVGAHEHEGNKTTIFWGNNTGVYLESKKTILPSVNNYGVILDFDAEDLDGDGDRDLVINRTGGGNSNFYIGRRSQLLINNGNRSFTDKTSQIDNPGVDNETWFPWIRIQDADNDGDLDILSDDLADEFFLKNDGSAKFTRI